MRLKNVPGAREAVAAHPLCINSSAGWDKDWPAFFGRSAPLFVEVGMGKGRFIIELALKHPEINFIGIERYESVMIRALQKLERMGENAPENIRFIRMDAQYINDFFRPREIQRIYLNFSDPWPKERHAKRRLTSRQFLAVFDRVLAPDGFIEFKTDNLPLFEFSLEELESAGWKLKYHSFDLHGDAEAMKDNIMTEYEAKFSREGGKIYKFIIYREVGDGL
ncbi:MAG: tRNA (guanosine(46)-N7)-methyltransferase TrmB [Lachnospiraceae bacterium]|nr:tRNA (guanosine(46)-N7)-methyltransferase TrmB [Lachnospiraceae bacterium]